MERRAEGGRCHRGESRREVLQPRETWGDKGAYDTTARDLTQRFEANFKQFEEYVDANVKAAGVYAA